MKIIEKWLIVIVTIIAITTIWFAIARADGNQPQQQQTELLVNCVNPAGCVGKLKANWPACPICNTPISQASLQERSGNIAEDIVALLEKAHSLDTEIGKIKVKREKDLQERLANMKTFDAYYADKVYDNLQKLIDAYERTKAYLERGGEDVDGSLISDFVGGEPVWQEKKYFIVYPKPR